MSACQCRQVGGEGREDVLSPGQQRSHSGRGGQQGCHINRKTNPVGVPSATLTVCPPNSYPHGANKPSLTRCHHHQQEEGLHASPTLHPTSASRYTGSLTHLSSPCHSKADLHI